MDDVYAINVAKSNYREGFNTADTDRVLSVFAPQFTDMSEGRPSRYGGDAPMKLRLWLDDLFSKYDARMTVIINRITILDNTAYDYGWHELTLIPKRGGEPVYRRTRYLEVWNKQADAGWKVFRYMDNDDPPDTV
jgi:ketosteroid isomerase-like protein